MGDKYIINPSDQQGQPENEPGAVGQPNVAAGEDLESTQRVRVGPIELPEHLSHIIGPKNEKASIQPREPAGRAMGEKIGK